MKKLILCLSLVIFAVEFVSAKKIKFQVVFDKNNLALDFTGGYVEGDFQKILGQADNWISNGNPMIKDLTDTLLYTLVVDLPAHRAYRYLFLRNSQDYAIEDVPEEAESISAHRWIYLDSTSNDTTVLPPVVYNGNAPFGKNLLRFKVDMKNVASISSKGVHLITNLSGWNLKSYYLYPIDSFYHEVIAYADTNIHTIAYRFVNGNDTTLAEIVPSACAANNLRTNTFNTHKVLPVVCFAKCDSICPKTSGIENQVELASAIYPNPFNQYTQINIRKAAQSIIVFNSKGEKVFESKEVNGDDLKFERQNLPEGIYHLQIYYKDYTIQNSKIIIQ
ncbi:MAG: T9SS type A sorting domain-containing protein [Bacteroidetes bacterium]|nr:T9SS type A sorting domain-containing protein [Bacteroidota bacterium]